MLEKDTCPFCGNELIEHNSTMWTGMTNQVLMYKLECVQSDHYFQVKAGTEEKLKEIINGRRHAKETTKTS